MQQVPIYADCRTYDQLHDYLANTTSRVAPNGCLGNGDGAPEITEAIFETGDHGDVGRGVAGIQHSYLIARTIGCPCRIRASVGIAAAMKR